MSKATILTCFLAIYFCLARAQSTACFNAATRQGGIFTNSQAWSIASGDFNTDGKLDLAVQSTSNSITIMQGLGSGRFSIVNVFTTTVVYSKVIAADFNGNGTVDIIAANSNSILLMQGNNNFTFGSGVNYNLSTGFSKLMAVDLNNDNYPDLIANTISANYITVLLNNNGNGFLAAQSITLGSVPYSLDVLDYDNDGQTDIITCDYSANSFSLLKGNGLGGFTPTITTTFSSAPAAVVSADFNNDNFDDFAILNFTLNTVTQMIGNGAGGFTPAGSYTVSTFASLHKGDFNNDGRMDLITLSIVNAAISVLRSNSTGGFYPAEHYCVSAPPHEMVLADFDSDGNLDVIASNTNGSGSGPTNGFTNNSALFIKGDGNGRLMASRQYPAGSFIRGLTANDFNQDGLPDIAVIHDTLNPPYPPGRVSVLFNTGNGVLGTPSIITIGARPGAITSADFNGDGANDIAVATYSGSLCLLINNGNGGFNTPAFMTVGGINATHIFSKDLNGDGAKDLVITYYGTGLIAVLLNNGSGGFSNWQAPGVSNAFSSAAGDFNGDGNIDLAVASNNLYFFWGSGGGIFSSGPSYAVPGLPLSLTEMIGAGDLNNDGLDDIVINSRVVLAAGNGTFNVSPLYPLMGMGDTYHLVRDMNGDGKQDVVSALPGNLVSIYYNSGNGQMNNPQIYDLSGQNKGLEIADFNGDGLSDLATGGPGFLPYHTGIGILLRKPAQFQMSISGPSVACYNSVITMTANGGANSVLWSTGQFSNQISILMPTSASFSVTGFSSTGCINTATHSVIVNTILATASPPSVCVGEAVNLSASGGALSYTWNQGTTGSSISVTPGATTAYVVNGKDSENCLLTAFVLVIVNACLSSEAISGVNNEPKVFPNPSQGQLRVLCNNCDDKTAIFKLYSCTGTVLKEQALIRKETSIQLEGFLPGVYFYSCQVEVQQVYYGKIIIRH